MEHIKVKWLHSQTNYPEWIYSELDEQRWEVRKIEIFPDGTLSCADDQTDSNARTGLGEVPLPALDVITTDQEFAPELISKAEFESMWQRAKACDHGNNGSITKIKRTG